MNLHPLDQGPDDLPSRHPVGGLEAFCNLVGELLQLPDRQPQVLFLRFLLRLGRGSAWSLSGAKP